MQIYLAARFSEKDRMKNIREFLEGYGHQITSTWLDEEYAPTTQLHEVTEEFKIKTAEKDIEDIMQSELILFFSVDPTLATVRGGRHFEAGYGYANGIPLWIVGPRENIFHYLPDVRQFDDVFEAMDAIEEEEPSDAIRKSRA